MVFMEKSSILDVWHVSEKDSVQDVFIIIVINWMFVEIHDEIKKVARVS